MTFSEIVGTIDRHTRRLETEAVPLLAAFGRVSARSISSGRDVPPFAVSALDGYGLKGTGTTFTVRRSLSPFAPLPFSLAAGEAFFIPTGGRLPKGVRFVAREHVTSETGRRIIVETGPDETRLVEKGDWLKKGRRLTDKGEVITPSAMALLALAGRRELTVYKRPTAAVITTGSELKKGLLVDSNAFLLAGLLQRDGGEIVGLYKADDRIGEIRALVERLSAVDLLILTGGTSKGKKDLTRSGMRQSGGRILLDSPPVVPGKTMAFGRSNATTFFILPGNPKATRTLYEVFVRRSLLKMAGRDAGECACTLPLPHEIRKPADKTAVISARLANGQTAIEETYPDEPNGFIVLPAGESLWPAGERVRVLSPC